MKRTNSPVIYQGENNADKILILIPETYNELETRSCTVTLNWIVSSNGQGEEREKYFGNIRNIDPEEELYKNLLQYIIPITNLVTIEPGNVELYLSISTSDKVLLKSSVSKLTVVEHMDITEYIPVESIDLLADYIIKMEQLENSCKFILNQAMEQANRAATTADMMIELLENWEAEHNDDL